ncbi:MAG: 2-oxo acid dehydrogenase subunit E2, partial [Flavobacteriaceae bacterium]|nr:2-oxo acid dehydrogenase subunit E2 [Flavobacteriaceae bacterium]
MSQIEFKMPKMGESITEGTIINWLVQEGDSFDEGDILVEIATDKVDNEVPAPSSGVMITHMVNAMQVVPVGDSIAVLELLSTANIGQQKVSTAKVLSEQKKVVQSKSKQKQTSQKQSSFRINENIFISPLVDAVARKHHISYEELARISGYDNIP